MYRFVKRVRCGDKLCFVFPVVFFVFSFLYLTNWLDGTTQLFIIWMNR
ncbi:hypothetical protein HmCmsJML019_03973 [Escherichia coli]|nr:hypothetical protein HmCmsJML019_03973 [Escherichia coli]